MGKGGHATRAGGMGASIGAGAGGAGTGAGGIGGCYVLAPFIFFYHVPCYIIPFTSPSAYHYCLPHSFHPYKPLYKA
jgi:hypothetical protein